ncbi:hypothetical protein HPT25_01640 [Bacillus sp. BRMEA1]|nr:hypothetical protein [Neobacillus endophyticus]
MLLSEIGHIKAQEIIYPAIFGPNITVENIGSSTYGLIPITETDNDLEKERKKLESIKAKERKKNLDGGMGIDTKIGVKISFEGINTYSHYTVQERTIRQYYGNIPIRLLNDYGYPSEFFHFNAMHFLLVVVNGGELQRWVWIPHATRVIDFIQKDQLKYDTISFGKSLSKFIVVNTEELKNVIPEIIEWDNQNGFSDGQMIS